jgi:hypothetical protein
VNAAGRSGTMQCETDAEYRVVVVEDEHVPALRAWPGFSFPW